MRVETPPDQAGHRERGRQVTVGLDGLQFAEGHGGEAGIDLKLDYQVFYFDKVGTCGLRHACGCPIFQ